MFGKESCWWSRLLSSLACQKNYYFSLLTCGLSSKMSVPCENADVLIGTVVSSSGTGTVFTPLQVN